MASSAVPAADAAANEGNPSEITPDATANTIPHNDDVDDTTATAPVVLEEKSPEVSVPNVAETPPADATANEGNPSETTPDITANNIPHNDDVDDTTATAPVVPGEKSAEASVPNVAETPPDVASTSNNPPEKSTEAKPKRVQIVPVTAGSAAKTPVAPASESKVQTPVAPASESEVQAPTKESKIETQNPAAKQLTIADVAAAVEMRDDCLEEGGKAASDAKLTLQNLVEKGVQNPNLVHKTDAFATDANVSTLQVERKDSFAGIHNKDFPTVLERKRNQRLAMNVTVFYKEGEAITGKPQPIGVTFLPKGTETTQESVVEVVSHTGKTAKKAQEPRVVASDDSESGSFGTWDGVWVSCVLNIFGVIMYRRLGWVVGEAGILGATLIILLSGVVTLLTTISMSAIATNGRVKGGGAYFLISRSVGPALGGSIGLLFTIGLCCGIAIYVVGFCETLIEVFGITAKAPGTADADEIANFNVSFVPDASEFVSYLQDPASNVERSLKEFAAQMSMYGFQFSNNETFTTTTTPSMISRFAINEGICTCNCTDESACSASAKQASPILFSFFEVPADLSDEGSWVTFKTNEIRVWGIFLMIFCLLMAIIGVGWIIKVQFVLLALILLSMLSIIIGMRF